MHQPAKLATVISPKQRESFECLQSSLVAVAGSGVPLERAPRVAGSDEPPGVADCVGLRGRAKADGPGSSGMPEPDVKPGGSFFAYFLGTHTPMPRSVRGMD